MCFVFGIYNIVSTNLITLLPTFFPKSTYIKQVLIELPTNKRHIKVPKYRTLCPTYVDNKNKQNPIKSVTRPRGVP